MNLKVFCSNMYIMTFIGTRFVKSRLNVYRLIISLTFVDIEIFKFQIDLRYRNSELNLTVNHKHKTRQIFGLRFNLSQEIIMGSGLHGKTNVGKIFDYR